MCARAKSIDIQNSFHIQIKRDTQSDAAKYESVPAAEHMAALRFLRVCGFHSALFRQLMGAVMSADRADTHSSHPLAICLHDLLLLQYHQCQTLPALREPDIRCQTVPLSREKSPFKHKWRVVRWNPPRSGVLRGPATQTHLQQIHSHRND